MAGRAPSRVQIPPGQGNRAGVRVARRYNGVQGVNQDKLRHRRRRAQTDPIARENMSRIRAHQPLLRRVQP